MRKVIEQGYRSAPCGTVDEATCEICGASCILARGVVGPTSWAEAIGRGKHAHDAIRCPHADEDWHNQAVRLHRAIADHPSERLRGMMREELHMVVTRGRAGEGVVH